MLCYIRVCGGATCAVIRESLAALACFSAGCGFSVAPRGGLCTLSFNSPSLRCKTGQQPAFPTAARRPASLTGVLRLNAVRIRGFVYEYVTDETIRRTITPSLEEQQLFARVDVRLAADRGRVAELFGDDVEDSRLGADLFCACAALIRGKNLIVCRIGVFCGEFLGKFLEDTS